MYIVRPVVNGRPPPEASSRAQILAWPTESISPINPPGRLKLRLFRAQMNSEANLKGAISVILRSQQVPGCYFRDRYEMHHGWAI